MIKFKNGHELDFACASGALAWYGEGWWWEKPLRWFGYIRPDEITIISKTLTYYPVTGNLKWWCPWRCVRLIPDGVVNAVGLTNGGYSWWIDNFAHKIEKSNRKVIASILPYDPFEARVMATKLSMCKLVGIEVNLSCPSAANETDIRQIERIITAVTEYTHHPVIIKLGYTGPYKEICIALDGVVDAFDLINTVPWDYLYPTESSPLAKYNLKGGVSGLPIREFARDALHNVKALGLKTPIISGGGIDSIQEVYARLVLGAKAVTLGTIFLRNPCKARNIVRECRRARNKYPNWVKNG